MRISVIIPTFNSAALVVEAVRSVLAQTHAVSEIIVVDDGSTDDTAERLAELGEPVRVIRQPNGGVSSARNRGIAAASGEWIAFLDADDVWHPQKLELQLAALDRHPQLVLLGTRTYAWPGSIPKLDSTGPGHLFVPEPVLADRDDLVIRNLFVTSTVLVRRDVLDRVGEFDTEQHGTEDYDLWLRVARVGPVANLPLPLTGYRAATPSSLSKNAVRMEAGMRRIMSRLDAAGVFRGRPGFRRKAWGYLYYSCGFMHQQGGRYARAARLAWQSLLVYPGRYDRSQVRYRFGRVRLALTCVRQMLLGSSASSLSRSLSEPSPS